MARGRTRKHVHLPQTSVLEAGTMTVTVTRAGIVKSATSHVVVVPCATGDSLLDSQEIRLGLQTLDIMSRQGDPGNRLEQGGYAFIDTLTGEISFLIGSGNYQDACSWSDAPWPKDQVPAHSVPIARAHSHPYDIHDVLPAGTMCKHNHLLHSTTLGLGPSPADDSIAMDGYASFVIDGTTIYRTDGPGQHQQWKRVNNGCQLLPPIVLNRIPRMPGLLLPRSFADTSKATTKRPIPRRIP